MRREGRPEGVVVGEPARRDNRVPAGVVVIERLPRDQREVYALEKACLKAAKAQGLRGEWARTQAVRIFNAAIEECKHRVRRPEALPGVVQLPPAHAGEVRSPGGIILRVPK